LILDDSKFKGYEKTETVEFPVYTVTPKKTTLLYQFIMFKKAFDESCVLTQYNSL